MQIIIEVFGSATFSNEVPKQATLRVIKIEMIFFFYLSTEWSQVNAKAVQQSICIDLPACAVVSSSHVGRNCYEPTRGGGLCVHIHRVHHACYAGICPQYSHLRRSRENSTDNADTLGAAPLSIIKAVGPSLNDAETTCVVHLSNFGCHALLEPWIVKLCVQHVVMRSRGPHRCEYI